MKENLEIEHKFVVPETYDVDRAFQDLSVFGSSRETRLTVLDNYYVSKLLPHHVFRYRRDEELCQLTVKSIARDTEIRYEVNMDLDRLVDGDTIRAFLEPLQISWTGSIEKKIRVNYYPECEVVFYVAKSGGKTIHCLEVEATTYATRESALDTIRRYEERLKLTSAARSKKSLFELLLLERMHRDLGH